MSVDGKVVLVTGVTSGIGKAVARVFTEQGAAVVGTGRRNALGEALAADLHDKAGSFTFVAGDVARVSDCEAAVEATIQGHGRIDVLINNAAIAGEVVDTHELREEQWDSVLDINLKGAAFCCRYAIPHMLARGAGLILNIASVAAVEAIAHQSAYNASKAALVQLTRSLAVEYVGTGIRANVILVGAVSTALGNDVFEQYGRHAGATDVQPAIEPIRDIVQRPREVAEFLALLCDDAARLMTGASIAVDRSVTAGWYASAVTHHLSSGRWS
jgi:NAD(P)-dependent dehydrogenase (short-subunit alcohol dehydrogenase family)